MCIATMMLPLGMCTPFMPHKTSSLFLYGQVSVRKWLVQPELATAFSRIEVSTG